ncbi:hypothetical protein ABIF44_004180 [Bradyrhizobium japonicum]|nr:hypothetical protein [Bradyrhizobium japonicum]MCS3989517.1 hypothetical protein [Bradyrhizobium japonicum]MCS4015667.1 hypothetical protein [Bradyrhizobium japonicum]MCS4202763.1 hypothetical protein [Bradyrhizobium japonicum]MDH6175588.1 hypothetical protein [Bradyrhizobium japonicum]
MDDPYDLVLGMFALAIAAVMLVKRIAINGK